ncbi:hypothetical protein [Rhodobacter calidifons]|uniref:Uncharacterized protein n=1 Tax=Rhodobacter calidifons TaxID=2715277 RepID=A0ABX0GB05_9RHOB|nr:hypothetical protein [Rhodobacter calidifons]NHB78474.1 hypothetical protein [Rhodobacter calidifons]
MTTAEPDPPQPDPDTPIETYPDAPDSLIQIWGQRRRRLKLAARDWFPPADLDLAPLLAARIPENLPPLQGSQTLHARKLHQMRVELAGKPELAAVNAILIAHLRKQRFPAHAPALFRRIWAEAGPQLMPELPGRWLISSAITFGDHGETEAQRRVGLSINILFSLMKLYEFERLHSGLDAATPFPIRRIRSRRLPLDMPHFNLGDGGLDINLLAQIWNEARKAPVVGPLACHLLQRLNCDPRGLFRRIGMMRAGKQMERIARAIDDLPPGPTETGRPG